MSSQIADVAEAVKDALNAAVASSGLSQTFEAKRVAVPLFDLKLIGTDIAVRVVPKSYTRTTSSRADVSKEIPVDVGITKRVAQTCDPTTEAGNAEIDPLLQLAEEIADLYSPGDAIGEAQWLRSEIPDPIYDVAKLREDRQFLCVIRFTFVIL